ncbi:MAG: hypothetical protein M3044_22575 [Thermoproteota archaeon]|jgi:hypothetical protein|nr:hypothetical protein [Thermoproteota archaeon]
MVGFVKIDKVKTGGRPFWKLLNKDLSDHVHKNRTVLTERNIDEKEKKPTSPSMEDKSYSTRDKDEMMFRMCLALKDIAKILKNSESYIGVEQSEDLLL